MSLWNVLDINDLTHNVNRAMPIEEFLYYIRARALSGADETRINTTHLDPNVIRELIELGFKITDNGHDGKYYNLHVSWNNVDANRYKSSKFNTKLLRELEKELDT